MLTDKKIQYILDDLLNDFRFEADVTDLDAKVIASTSKVRIGQKYSNLPKQPFETNKSAFTQEGRYFAAICSDSRIRFYISLEGSNRVAKDYAILIAKLIEVSLSLSNRKLSREDCLRRILSGDIAGFDIEEAISEYKIDSDMQRCVFVIRTPKQQGDKAYDIMSEAFSKKRMDFLVHMDHNTIALIKTVTDDIETGDFAQLAAAIFETVFSETSIKIVVGVGSCKTGITRLRESYHEAHKALEVGLIFNSGESVHIYDSLLLERFVNQIPGNVSDAFLSTIFTEEFNKLFNSEMSATVKNLFDNSLNLSETARRLYIHRNTLVYRIDKIKKSIGLDIRNFHDAVTFRIMMMLKMRR
jgi:carbohydrate diacid regulator